MCDPYLYSCFCEWGAGFLMTRLRFWVSGMQWCCTAPSNCTTSLNRTLLSMRGPARRRTSTCSSARTSEYLSVSSQIILILAQFFVLTSISLRSILILSYRICLGLPRGLLPVGLFVTILKALLPSILGTYLVYLNLLDLITLYIRRMSASVVLRQGACLVIQGLWVETQLRSMDFSGHKNPEH